MFLVSLNFVFKMFHCKHCRKSFEPLKSLLDHIRYNCKLAASSLVPFACGQDNCSHRFLSAPSLKRHIQSKHATEEIDDIESPLEISDNESPSEIILLADSLESKFEHSLMTMFSNFYRNPQITRSSVQAITLEIRNFFDLYTEIIESCVINGHLPFTSVSSSCRNIFKSFDSEHKRFKIFTEAGKFVAPIEMQIGSRIEYKHVYGRTIRNVVQCTSQVIPLKQVLTHFFNMPNVLSDTVEYLNSVSMADSPIENICQGSVWLHNVEPYEPGVIHLPLIIYFDDFETNNPLGTHNVIQKLGGLYASLPCLPRKYFSLLSNILLVSLFHAADRVNVGNKVTFHAAIQQLNDLHDNGIKIKFDGSDVILKFRVACFTGDNLGLNGIFGFVESFGAAYCCRICHSNKEQRHSVFREDTSLLRNRERYLQQIASTVDVSLTGIKEPCAWLNLKGFDFLDGCLDLMHDYLEGCCRYVMLFVIKYLVKKAHFFTLNILQERLKAFNYGPDNSARPTNAILIENSKIKIRTSASEMLTLVRYFALIVGKDVPREDPVWNLFLTLRKVLQFLLTHRVFKENMGYLSDIIEDLCCTYKSLSEKDGLPPKFHFLTHYPSMQLKFGPLTQIWTFRFEAKHRFMKTSARVSSNKLNICKTIAIRNQLSLNGLFSDPEPFKFVKFGKEYGIRNELHSDIERTFQISSEFIQNLYSVKWVKVNGVYFSESSIILIDINVDFDQSPMFAQVYKIFVERGTENIIFYSHRLHCQGFEPHFFAYEVIHSKEPLFTRMEDLYQPVLTHTISKIGENYYVTVRVTLE